MTFWSDPIDPPDEESPAETSQAARAKPGTGRGLLQLALGCSGWLLVVLLVWFTGTAPLGRSSYLGLFILFAALLFAGLVSTTAILVACAKRSWGIAPVSLVLAVACVVVTAQQNSPFDYIDYQYQAIALRSPDWPGTTAPAGWPAK